MASYAEIASHGPKQTDAEVCSRLRSRDLTDGATEVRPQLQHNATTNKSRVPHAVPEILHDDSSVHSLNSQGSINVPNSVPSYAEQGRQAEIAASRQQQEAEDEAKRFARQAENKAAELERDTKKAYNDVKKEASKDYEQVKKAASKEADKAKKSAQKAEKWAEDNKGNPVVVGNAVVVTALAGLLGIGAYRKYVAGELTWKVAGAWAGVVGLFAVGDYYVSSWLFKNKYPPKN